MRIQEAKEDDLEMVTMFSMQMLRMHSGLDDRYREAADAEKRYRAHLEAALDDPDKLLLVAADKDIVGFLLVELHKRPPVLKDRKYAMISDAFVREDCRRDGVAKLLVKEAFRWIEDRGIRSVELSVHDRNPVAKKVWESFGFRPFLSRYRLEL
jgi:ribosomal protein S18 acetylase RimI-like enzyme